MVACEGLWHGRRSHRRQASLPRQPQVCVPASRGSCSERKDARLHKQSRGESWESPCLSGLLPSRDSGHAFSLCLGQSWLQSSGLLATNPIGMENRQRPPVAGRLPKPRPCSKALRPRSTVLCSGRGKLLPNTTPPNTIPEVARRPRLVAALVTVEILRVSLRRRQRGGDRLQSLVQFTDVR